MLSMYTHCSRALFSASFVMIDVCLLLLDPGQARVTNKESGVPVVAPSISRGEDWWRGWDSNPRCRSLDMAVFKTAAFNRSATSPLSLVAIV